MLENPPSPLYKGENSSFVCYILTESINSMVEIQSYSPLKRGLGGFSEPIFEMGKLFNHESIGFVQR